QLQVDSDTPAIARQARAAPGIERLHLGGAQSAVEDPDLIQLTVHEIGWEWWSRAAQDLAALQRHHRLARVTDARFFRAVDVNPNRFRGIIADHAQVVPLAELHRRGGHETVITPVGVGLKPERSRLKPEGCRSGPQRALAGHAVADK